MTNNNTRQLAAQLIELAVREGLIEDEDRIYAANRLCDRLRLDGGPAGRTTKCRRRSGPLTCPAFCRPWPTRLRSAA